MAKFLILLLIIACLAPLFIKGPDGEPLMTLEDWKIQLPDSLSEMMPAGGSKVQPESVSPASKTTVYKWQDEHGQWHFSSVLPDDVSTAEKLELSGDINLMEAYVPTQTPEQADVATKPPSGVMTASPDQIKEMMETVTNLQGTLDARGADIDAILAPAPDN